MRGLTCPRSPTSVWSSIFVLTAFISEKNGHGRVSPCVKGKLFQISYFQLIKFIRLDIPKSWLNNFLWYSPFRFHSQYPNNKHFRFFTHSKWDYGAEQNLTISLRLCGSAWGLLTTTFKDLCASAIKLSFMWGQSFSFLEFRSHFDKSPRSGSNQPLSVRLLHFISVQTKNHNRS